MNYSEVMSTLNTATLFDLFRISIAISNELQNPNRIKAVRQAFKTGDKLTYFDEHTNGLRSGIVLEKHIKYVSLLDEKEQRIWKIPYCLLNLGNINTDIHSNRHDKLSKNNLKNGDCVGFNKDGMQISGIVTRLNDKTASIITADHKRWRASYSCLYKIIDADLAKQFESLNIID